MTPVEVPASCSKTTTSIPFRAPYAWLLPVGLSAIAEVRGAFAINRLTPPKIHVIRKQYIVVRYKILMSRCLVAEDYFCGILLSDPKVFASRIKQEGRKRMLTLYRKAKARVKDETGQTMVEYVMLIVLVALAVFLLTPNIKSAIIQVFSNTSSALQ